MCSRGGTASELRRKSFFIISALRPSSAASWSRSSSFKVFWSQRNGFSGHEWPFDTNRCRYAPTDDVTEACRPVHLYLRAGWLENY